MWRQISVLQQVGLGYRSLRILPCPTHVVIICTTKDFFILSLRLISVSLFGTRCGAVWHMKSCLEAHVYVYFQPFLPSDVYVSAHSKNHYNLMIFLQFISWAQRSIQLYWEAFAHLSLISCHSYVRNSSRF